MGLPRSQNHWGLHWRLSHSSNMFLAHLILSRWLLLSKWTDISAWWTEVENPHSRSVHIHSHVHFYIYPHILKTMNPYQYIQHQYSITASVLVFFCFCICNSFVYIEISRLVHSSILSNMGRFWLLSLQIFFLRFSLSSGALVAVNLWLSSRALIKRILLIFASFFFQCLWEETGL